ncbi:MAG: helix-turn-helix domain containing protein [Ruminococcus sp.]|nr:helix-turn-helix domain containing protein [Ruminococcus sp.]
MDILDRITMLLGSREQQELTEYLNLKKTAYTDWKSGKSKSYRKYLIEISEFFNVSIDYLVYGKETRPPNECLTPDERQFIDKFNRLEPIDKGRILERMDMIYENYPPDRPSAPAKEPPPAFTEPAEPVEATLDQRKYPA